MQLLFNYLVDNSSPHDHCVVELVHGGGVGHDGGAKDMGGGFMEPSKDQEMVHQMKENSAQEIQAKLEKNEQHV